MLENLRYVFGNKNVQLPKRILATFSHLIMRGGAVHHPKTDSYLVILWIVPRIDTVGTAKWWVFGSSKDSALNLSGDPVEAGHSQIEQRSRFVHKPLG